MGILRGEDRILKDPRFLLENNREWEQDFFFIQGADTQLGLMYNYGTNGQDGTPYPASEWSSEIELCKKSVEIMNKMNPRPAFFIVCGDLVDAMPDKFPEIRKKQELDLKEIYSKLDPSIPMICVCGNHDVGQRPTPETLRSYNSSFGDDYFSFSFKGVFFIVLNSQFYEDSSNCQEEYKAHEEWLEGILNLEERKTAKHTIVFQHIPWFLNEPGEEKDYFNIEPVLRREMLYKFHTAGIRKIFCGHFHRNAGGFYKDLEVIVTSAIGCQIGPDQHGMRIVQCREDKIVHTYHALNGDPSAGVPEFPVTVVQTPHL